MISGKDTDGFYRTSMILSGGFCLWYASSAFCLGAIVGVVSQTSSITLQNSPLPIPASISNFLIHPSIFNESQEAKITKTWLHFLSIGVVRGKLGGFWPAIVPFCVGFDIATEILSTPKK